MNNQVDFYLEASFAGSKVCCGYAKMCVCVCVHIYTYIVQRSFRLKLCHLHNKTLTNILINSTSISAYFMEHIKVEV